MNEQKVWVRVYEAAVKSGKFPPEVDLWPVERADTAVAEWRKRYGGSAEPAPAPFKVGDRVIVEGDSGKIVEFWSHSTCVVEFPSGGRSMLPVNRLTLDHTPPQR